MTQSDIDRIKTYIAAATPGPWAVVVRARRAVNGASIENEDGCRVAFLSPKADKPIDQKIADGQLIANARTDLPAAIAEIERLNQAMAGLVERIGEQRAVIKDLSERDELIENENAHLKSQLKQAKAFRDIGRGLET